MFEQYHPWHRTYLAHHELESVVILLLLLLLLSMGRKSLTLQKNHLCAGLQVSLASAPANGREIQNFEFQMMSSNIKREDTAMGHKPAAVPLVKASLHHQLLMLSFLKRYKTRGVYEKLTA